MKRVRKNSGESLENIENVAASEKEFTPRELVAIKKRDEKIVTMLREINALSETKDNLNVNKEESEALSLAQVNLYKKVYKLIEDSLKKEIPELKIIKKSSKHHQNIIEKMLKYYESIIKDEKYKDLEAENAILLKEKTQAEIQQNARRTIKRIQTKERKVYLQKIQELETIIHAKETIADMPFKVPGWTEANGKDKANLAVPVLFLSDLHYGETINPKELDGLNAYNVSVARARYRRTISRSINILERNHLEYSGIILLRGGDFISGEIHAELQQTNHLNSLMSLHDLLQEEHRGIHLLEKKFGNVWVISVPGNHGRITVKPQAKSYAYNNYDYLLSKLLEDKFKDNGNVSFLTPESGDAYFTVMGYNFLLTHGDRIGSRGGTGFIGPSANMLKGAKKIRDGYAAEGKIVDYVVMGHFHTPLFHDGVIANASLPGYSEYARNLRVKPAPASQTLFKVNKFGVTGVENVIVQNDKEDMKLYEKELLPQSSGKKIEIPDWLLSYHIKNKNGHERG